jgi:hypothetical protein
VAGRTRPLVIMSSSWIDGSSGEAFTFFLNGVRPGHAASRDYWSAAAGPDNEQARSSLPRPSIVRHAFFLGAADFRGLPH